jgi:hypothetical protein
LPTDGLVVRDEADEMGIGLARKSDARADAVYVVDMAWLAHLHGWCQGSVIE